MNWLKHALDYADLVQNQIKIAAVDEKWHAAVKDALVKVVTNAEVEVRASFDNDGELALAGRTAEGLFRQIPKLKARRTFDLFTRVITFELANGSALILKRKAARPEPGRKP